MKNLMLVIAALAALNVFAFERSPEAQRKMLEHTGGIIQIAPTGKIVVMNCQQKIPTADVQERVEKLVKLLKFNFVYAEGTWKFGDEKPADANLVIYLVDDASLPMSLNAPEAHWSVMNVNEIDAGPRFRKQFMRVAVNALSAGVSQNKASPMQPISKVSDLDKIVADGIAFDAVAGIMTNLKALGVTVGKKTTYRKACQEGWAPAPTNEFQKVIWDKVHELPSKPITIEK